MLFSEGAKPQASLSSRNLLDYEIFDEVAFVLSGIKSVEQISEGAWQLIRVRLAEYDIGQKRQGLSLALERELVKKVLSELQNALCQTELKESDSRRMMNLIEIYTAIRMINNIKSDILKKLGVEEDEDDGSGGIKTRAGLVIPKYRKHFG